MWINARCTGHIRVDSLLDTMYWKNEQTTAKESPSKNTVSDTLISLHFQMSFRVLSATLISLLF